MKTILRIGIVVVLLCLIAFPIQAQDKEKKETPYWYVSHFKIPWAKIDSLYKFEKEYTPAIVEEAKKQGTILDYKMLLHHTGDEYNVVVMTKLPSWCSIEGTAWGWWTATYKTIEKDKKKIEKVLKARNWMFDGLIHKDLIYGEVE